MKRIIALFLSVAMLLTGCTSANNNEIQNTDIVSQIETTEEVIAESVSEITEWNDIEVQYDSLDDEMLLTHIEDLVYSEAIKSLDSENYFVENVSAVYISKEYLEEVAYNSQSNIYFGYTLAELNDIFEGSKYIFTLAEDGTTTVQEMQIIEDTDTEEILKNVAIGTGVILLCVTVSVITGGAGAPAVSMIFAASAKTGAIMALSSAAIGGVSAGVVRGIETGDMNEALEAAALAGSDGFKWGAIVGSVSGGASQTIALKGATLNGLTMNEAALIQKQSGYPLDVIKQFHTMDEYLAFKNANLKPTMIGGKTALVRTDIDLTMVDAKGRTNLERMRQGLAPQDSNGISYELHHVGQKKDGTLAILSRTEHDNPAIHGFLEKTEAHAAGTNWDAERKAFWKAFAELVE